MGSVTLWLLVLGCLIRDKLFDIIYQNQHWRLYIYKVAFLLSTLISTTFISSPQIKIQLMNGRTQISLTGYFPSDWVMIIIRVREGVLVMTSDQGK